MAKTSKKIHIVGISQCFLETAKKQILDMFMDKKTRIDVVFARKEDLSLLLWVREQATAANKNIVLENNGNITRLNNAAIFYDSKINFITEYVKRNLGKKNILIIANGDPNFFGIGGTILGQLKENEKRFIEIYPAVSFMQAGFAKLKIPMNEALIVSLHGRDFNDLHETLNAQINAKKSVIGLYTDEINTPYKIHTWLGDEGLLKEFEFYVLTELCSKKEKIYKNSTKEILSDISGKKNIVILNGRSRKSRDLNLNSARLTADNNARNTEGNNESNKAGKTADKRMDMTGNIVFGIDDEKYIHDAGEPTKKEIRSVSLASMNLRPDSIVLDAGCGSGSISIEAAAIASEGKVYSIDKNGHKIENLKKNMKKFGRQNIEPFLGELPKAVKTAMKTNLADSVFIGGGGAKNIAGILRESLDVLKDNGIVVANVVTVESLSAVLSFIKDFNQEGDKNIGLKYEIISINVSRLKSIKDKDDSYFQALNQIYIVKIGKSANRNAANAATTASPSNLGVSGNRKTMTFKIEHNRDNAGKPNVKIKNKNEGEEQDRPDKRSGNRRRKISHRGNGNKDNILNNNNNNGKNDKNQVNFENNGKLEENKDD